MSYAKCEKMIGLAAAAKHPLLRNQRTRKPCHISTMTRRIIDGVRATDGTVVKLRATRFPDDFMTCEKWIREFFDELQRHSFSRCATDEAAAAGVDEAEAELAAEGI